MTDATAMPTPQRRTLDRLLAPFVDAREGEAGTALLLMLNVFVLLTCYYILKPVREALILSTAGHATAARSASKCRVASPFTRTMTILPPVSPLLPPVSSSPPA